MQETDFDYEINVIEDCSTDRTAAIIIEYAKKYPDRVFPFLNKKNIGYKVTQKNFFRGFKTLTGEYLAILEGDDYWTSPQKLQKQVDFLDKNPDFAICAHNTIKIYEDGSKEPHRFLYFGKQPDGTIDDVISLRMFFHTTTVLYRNVFNGVPPRHYENSWSCDIFILISHAAFGKVYHLDEDLAAYRAHTGGRFSTMTTLDGWFFNIGGLMRYNAWLGYRYMRPFSKAIAKYCTVVLTESGKGDVKALTFAQKVKYTGIWFIHQSIYNIIETPRYCVRAMVYAQLSLTRRRSLWDLNETRKQPASDGSEQQQGYWPRIQSPALFSKLLAWGLRANILSDSLPPISNFGPQPVEHGTPFNAQSNGLSAIWLMTEKPVPPQTTIIFAGWALPTVVKDKVLTAFVPPGLTAKAGSKPIWLESADFDGLRISAPVQFDVG